MRFECDSCHAKYKISEEKVRGRVVRFPCRKCEHKILIDGRQREADVTVPAGSAYNFEDVTRKSEPVSPFSTDEAATARARRPASPPRRRSPSVPPRRASAASRRVSSVPATANTARAPQHPGLAPPVPSPSDAAPAPQSGDAPQWHVSINDVPVGPIRLEEMAHKVDAGAVSEYSLVWRHGFEEWRPLATVPELMSLLHERRHSGPPARAAFSSMPPFVETKAPVTEDSPPAAVPLPPSAFSAPPAAGAADEIAPIADSLQPEPGIDGGLSEMSQPPAPIGPEDVFQSSPQLGSFSGLAELEEEDGAVSVPSSPPQVAAASAEPRRGISVGVLALIVAIAVFSGVVGFLVFDRYGEQLLGPWMSSGPSPVNTARPQAPVAPVPLEASAEVDAAKEPQANDSDAAPEVTDRQEEREDKAATLVPPPDPKDESAKMAPAPRPTSRTRPAPDPVRAADTATATEPEESSLSSDEQKLLDEFGSGADAPPAKIDVQESRTTQSKNPPLDGDAIRSTVSANKARLQRCYERAIRGQQSPPSVRLDVTVRVAPSGRVKNVSSQGEGPGGLAACVEASVRRWRFPASAEGGPAKFPIVFSSN